MVGHDLYSLLFVLPIFSSISLPNKIESCRISDCHNGHYYHPVLQETVSCDEFCDCGILKQQSLCGCEVCCCSGNATRPLATVITSGSSSTRKATPSTTAIQEVRNNRTVNQNANNGVRYAVIIPATVLPLVIVAIITYGIYSKYNTKKRLSIARQIAEDRELERLHLDQHDSEACNIAQQETEDNSNAPMVT